MLKQFASLVWILFLLTGVFLSLDGPIVRSTTDATSGAYVYDDSDFIYLGNDFLEIKFSKNEKGAIYSFINKLAGQDYRTDKTCYNRAWEMMISTPNNLDVYEWFDSNAYEGFFYDWSSLEDGFLLSMLYSGGPYQMTITATVGIVTNSSLTRWRFYVNNNEPDWAVEEVRFPLLTGFQKLGDSNDDYILLSNGIMIHDPYNNVVIGGRSDSGGIYPSYDNGVQLMLIGDKLGGLYWAAYDTECYAKIFAADREGTSIIFRIAHLNSLSKGQNYSTGYDNILGAFEGRYENALSLYREWGTKQWWVKNGMISERNLPEWFKQGFTMTIITSYTGDFEDGQWQGLAKNIGFEAVPQTVDNYSQALRCPILLRWLGWERYGAWVSPNFFPSAEGKLKLQQTITELHQEGYHVILGMSAGIWDTCISDYDTTGKACTIWDREENPKIMNDGQREVALVSSACETWRQILVNNTLQVAETGADGVQLDAWLHQPVDYNPMYEHPKGAGNWYTKELLKTLQEIKTKTTAINPQFIIASEGVSEPLLPYIDLFMSKDMDQLMNLKDEYGEYETMVPLFSFVYRKYAIPFGRELLGYDGTMRSILSSSSPLFLDHIVAFGMVAGELPEIGDWGLPNPSKIGGIVPNITFLSFACPQDLYSNMLEFMPCASPTVGIGDMTIPNVLSSIWESNSGALRFLFANIGNDSYTDSLNLDLAKYGLENNGNYSVALISDDSFQFLFTKNAPLPVELNLTITARSVALLDVCHANESLLNKARWKAAVGCYMYSSILPQVHARKIAIGPYEDLFRRARLQMISSKTYEESIALAAEGLLNLANSLKRFSSVLNEPESFQSLINEAEDLNHKGNFFEAASKAFEACDMILRSMTTPIFFDNLHTDRDYFPSFSYYIFKSHFESTGYEVKMSQAVPMSWSELNGTRAAVFWAPSRGFKTTEINMILEYVKEGNNLIMLLDGWMPDSLNELTMTFGVEVLQGAVIAEDHYENDEGTFVVNNFTKHPVTEGMSISEANWIAPLKTKGNARTIAYTSNDTWTSEDPRIVGPFAYIACSTYGLGKVLVVADNLFMELAEHLTILDNAIEWFLGDYWQALLVDLNKDGQVNILDITIVATAYGSQAGSENWNQLADLDENGMINILDIALVAKGYGRIL